MGERVLRVTGKGQLKVKPDMTRITMMLEGVRKDYAKALKASAEDTENLKSLLAKEGFSPEDVKTVSFNVEIKNESYRDKEGDWKSKFVGYQYRHVVKIEFPSDNKRLGVILALVANNGMITPGFRFSFFVKDVEASKNELLAKAVTDAKEKATVLSKAVGVALKEIVSVDYSWGEIDFEVSPMGRMEDCTMLKESSACYEMDIEPDDIEMSDTVTVVWHIE